MTPLAFELAQDIFGGELRIRETDPAWPERRCADYLWRIIHEAKFFDCSEVWTSIIGQLAHSMHETFEKHDRFDARLAFLPDKMTWLESETPGFRDGQQALSSPFRNQVSHPTREWNYTYRTAHIFVASQDDITGVARRLILGYETPKPKDDPRVWRLTELESLPLVHSGMKPQRHKTLHHPLRYDSVELETPESSVWDFCHYAALAVINTPRIIGARTHFPHERLEREKVKALKMVGKFPLRAWTEIILKVAPPDDKTGEPSRETHLTGERCLHFCRSHIRVRYGRLEYVAGHWRGDPSLGIKRSRYRLEEEANE